jgi:2'-5' RNA ligase
VSLSVCLLLDATGDHAVRRLWTALEGAGVATLATHTHGHHVPHLSYASLRGYDLEAVRSALAALPEAAPVPLHFDGFGTFRRSRCWLAPAITSDLAARQQRVVEAVQATGADLHRHYRPGDWVPHLTLAPRLHLRDLATVAALVYDVLPLAAVADRVALVDTSTGRRRLLPHLV